MDPKGDTPDRAVGRLAARQYGVVSTAQLLQAGMTRDAIQGRVRAGRLHRVHRGVYAVGHVGLAVEGYWMAAILACGSGRSHGNDSAPREALATWGAALSHRSAAELWGILPALGRHIQVSVSGTSGKRRRQGLHVHRSRTLTAEVVTSHRGIPVTDPARTISDLRRAAKTKGCPAAISPRELRRAIRQAGVLGLQIGESDDLDRTRSELEAYFLRLCRKHGLPAPEVNVRIDSFLVDFLWRARRVVVETDGYRYHRGKAAFEDDRNRDLRLKSLGYEVVRLSYKQVRGEPDRVARAMQTLLSASVSPFGPT